MADHSAEQKDELMVVMKGNYSVHNLARQTAEKRAHLSGRSRGKKTALKRGILMALRLVEQMACLMAHHSAGCWVGLMADLMAQPWACHWVFQKDVATAETKADKMAVSTVVTTAVSKARNWVHKKAGQMDCQKVVH